MILADKIMNLRKQQGMSQEELAHQLGISRQSVSKWESGASIPDLDKILNSLNKDKYKDISSYELKNKVITKLLQKGYEYSDIKELIKDFEF